MINSELTNFDYLPIEIVGEVFDYFNYDDFNSSKLVSKKWKRFVENQLTYQVQNKFSLEICKIINDYHHKKFLDNIPLRLYFIVKKDLQTQELVIQRRPESSINCDLDQTEERINYLYSLMTHMTHADFILNFAKKLIKSKNTNVKKYRYFFLSATCLTETSKKYQSIFDDLIRHYS